MDYRPITLIFLVLIASGCVSDQVSEDTTKAGQAVEEASESNAYMVEYTDSGFAPENIVIQKGDTVRWIDSSNRELLVTTEYSSMCPVEGFSSCETVTDYNHTFNEDGRYVYRNSNKLNDQATITVQRKNLP